MLRRIKSALFIDFENMPLARETIDNWLAWLEDGKFDGDKRRRFLLKQVYWNSSALRFKSVYEASGFNTVPCDRYFGLANSVDVQMAIDIIEATYQHPGIDEYILITADTDFVPVLKRLREMQKRTAFMINETKLNIHTTYRQHADVLIPIRELILARQYERPQPGLLRRLGRRLTGTNPVARPNGHAKPPAVIAAPQQPRPTPVGQDKAAKAVASKPETPAKPPAAKPAPAKAPPQPKPPVPKLELPNALSTAQALECVVALTSNPPNRLTSRARVTKALEAVPGFASSGKTPYLGYSSYKAFMQELSRLDPRLEVTDQPDGGMAIKFVSPPKQAAPAEEPAAPKSIEPVA